VVKRLRHPKDKLQENMQRLDMAELRLKNAMERRLQLSQQKISNVSTRLQQHKPDKRLALLQQHTAQLKQRLELAIKQQIAALQQKLARQAEVLNAVSPLSTLSRGYAIITTQQGVAVTDSKQVNVGETLNAQLHQGKLTCTVQGQTHDE